MKIKPIAIVGGGNASFPEGFNLACYWLGNKEVADFLQLSLTYYTA